MTQLLAVIGVALVIVAIPLGLMLAPLVIGAVLLAYAMRRADQALNDPFRGSAA
jgi:hypothetical protein